MNTVAKIRQNRWVRLVVITVLYTFLSKATEGILIADNSFRPAIALLAVYSAIEGPIFGFFVGFLGNAGVDWLTGTFWWNWSMGNGIIGLVTGLLFLVSDYEPKKGKIHLVHYGMFVILAAVGNYVGLILAALIDVWVSHLEFQLVVFQWAFTPATVNILMVGTLGVGGLYLYTRAKRINL